MKKAFAAVILTAALAASFAASRSDVHSLLFFDSLPFLSSLNML